MEEVAQFFADHWLGLAALVVGVPGALLAIRGLRRRRDESKPASATTADTEVSVASIQATGGSAVNVGSGTQATASAPGAVAVGRDLHIHEAALGGVVAAQRADVHGRDNVVIQIEGDGNTVLVHLPHLTLTRYLARRAPPVSDIGLLSPYALSIPMVGRDPMMAALQRWQAAAQGVSIRVLTGRAGSGKTRLALELCDAAVDQGWDAGFVTHRELVRFGAQQNLAAWGWQQPTLLVIDYAAAHSRLLHEWFVELSTDRGTTAHPLRILLLERHADPAGGWWESVFGIGGWDAQYVRQLLDPPGPVVLPSLADPDDRRRVFTTLLERHGSNLRAPDAGADPTFDQRLAELTWAGEPLLLMMAALVAAERGFASVLSLARTDLAFEIARREMSRLERLANDRDVDGHFLCHMAAYATLCQGLGRDEFEEAVAEEQTALRRSSAGDPARVAEVLHDAWPAADGGIESVRPDMVAEALVLEAWARLSPQTNLGAIERAVHRGRSQVVATIIRTAQDYASVRTVPLEWLDRVVKLEEGDVSALMRLSDLLPETTLVLRERAATITFTILERLRVLVTAHPDTFQPNLASTLNNLGCRLSALGRRQEALAAAQEAVEVLSPRFLDHPAAFADWMRTMVRNYLERSKQCAREPNTTLLTPIVTALEVLTAEPDENEPD